MTDLLYEKLDRYAVFTLNRPHRLNALGGTMAADLNDALADFNDDPEMRAGIVTGAGRAFSAGADLKEMNERNVGRGDEPAPISEFDPVRGLPFSRSRKPFVAAINGLCIAGGLERALDCDIRICSTDAYFGLFEVKRGMRIAQMVILPVPRTCWLETDQLPASVRGEGGFGHTGQ